MMVITEDIMSKSFSFSWPVDIALALLMVPFMLIMFPTFLYEAWRE